MKHRPGTMARAAGVCTLLAFTSLPTRASGEEAFVPAMHGSMAKMMDAMGRAGMSGVPDRDFLAMMIPHHQGAVDMARLELIHGRDPLARQLAEQIIANQTAAIQAMQARLAILKNGGDADPGGYPAVHGTRGNSGPEAK